MRDEYFTGFLLPDELAQTIERYRQWMRERFGCQSGQKSAAHITLIPPFCDAAGTAPSLFYTGCEELIRTGLLPLSIEVSGFGAFGKRCLYAHVVPNARWDEVRSRFYRLFREGGCVIPSGLLSRPLIPHISIANRDIPSGAIPEALSVFAASDLSYCFDGALPSLFTRRASGSWHAEYIFQSAHS